VVGYAERQQHHTTEHWAIEVDAGEPEALWRGIGTEGAILPDNLSGTRTASDWPL